MIGKVIVEFLHVDSRLFKTLRALLLHPGLLSAEFSENKRAYYIPPVRLYLVSSVLLFSLILGGDNILRSMIENFDRFMEDIHVLPVLMFLAQLISALLLRVVYFNKRINYIEHMVFSMHVHSVAFIGLTVYVLMIFVLGDIMDELFGLLIPHLIMAIYLFFAMKKFYKDTWLCTFVKLPILIGGYALFVGGGIGIIWPW